MTTTVPNDPISPGRSQVSRRTIAKGIAWTAPALIVASAAPAYAISAPPPTVVAGGQCKLPGGSCNPLVKGYLFAFTITNSSGVDVWLYTGGSYGPVITDNSPTINLVYEKAVVNGVVYEPGQHILLPAGSTVRVLLNAGENTNSADLAGLTITTSFQWGHSATPSGDTQHIGDPVVSTMHVDGTPPCESCTL